MDSVDDLVGSEWEAADLLGGGDSRQHEDRVHARFHPGDDVGVHAIADHRGAHRMRADPVQGRAEHHRVRLAHDVGLAVRRLRDECGDGAGGRQDALGAGAGGVRVRDDEAGAGIDEADRLRDRLERIGVGLTDDDELGVVLCHDEPGLVDRRGQPRLADDIGRAVLDLIGQEIRGGHRRGPDVRLGDVESVRAQPGGEVTRGVDGIVRQHQIGDVRLTPLGEQLRGSRQRIVLLDQDTVHIGQPAVDRIAIHVSPRTRGGPKRLLPA